MSHLPQNCSIALSNQYQRIDVVGLCRSSELQQQGIQSSAHISRCNGYFLSAAVLQIDTPDRSFTLFIIRILPVAEHMAIQATPAPMPSAKSGNILEHGEETSVVNGDRQLAVYLHVNGSFQWADTGNGIEGPVGSLNFSEGENYEAILDESGSANRMWTGWRLNRWHYQP